MSGNTFGKVYKVTTFGESHGKAIGGIIDGVIPGFEIDVSKIQADLNLRKPGQSKVTTSRKENDEFEFLSGILNGKTTGTPIGFIIYNENQQSSDYEHLKNIYRPSHADFTYQQKYGIRDYRGGGRQSARETACRVIGGSLAKQILFKLNNITFTTYTYQIGSVKCASTDHDISIENIQSSIVRCPDKTAEEKMIKLIEYYKNLGDSIGGIVRCIIKNVPIGLGAPVFDKLQADLAKAMLSINAAKGFQYGLGFSGIERPGSEYNDVFEVNKGKISTKTNNSGGIQGGISNGENIYFDVAFKPASSIQKKQETVDVKGNTTHIEIQGRHDPCIVPRAVSVVEAMAAMTILDHYLMNKMY